MSTDTNASDSALGLLIVLAPVLFIGLTFWVLYALGLITTDGGNETEQPPTTGIVVDLDCDDFDGPVVVPPNDPNGLDADNDGVGCED